MDSSPQAYRLYLFTVHLWQERIDADQVEWRGRITNTSTGAVAYFRRWRDVEGLLPDLLDEGAYIEHTDLEDSPDFQGSMIEVEILTNAPPDEDQPDGNPSEGETVECDSTDDPANDGRPPSD